jgi:tyrosyl-tRNA synthetase
MGKTAKGAVWLDPDKTTPYDFYQYWRNIGDADVLKCLRMMTFLPLEQIDEMDKWEGAKLNTAKEILASELTTLVHGSDEAKKAKAGAEALFSAATPGNMENVPTATLADEDFSEEGTVDILTILVKAGLEKSRGDARRDVNQGGVTVDGEKVTDFKAVFSKDDLKDGKLVKRGKKSFKLVKY